MKPKTVSKEVETFLKENVIYNKETGLFFREDLGRPVGYKDAEGYQRASFKGTELKLHRLAWFLTNNEWPLCIDHVNGDRSDNRLINLRSVTKRDNSGNLQQHRKGKLVGAVYRKDINRWCSYYRKNGKTFNLGLFNTEIEAHSAYMEAKNTNGKDVKLKRPRHLRGVTFSKTKQKYHVRVNKNKKEYHVGYFETEEEAIKARDLFKENLNET